MYRLRMRVREIFCCGFFSQSEAFLHIGFLYEIWQDNVFLRRASCGDRFLRRSKTAARVFRRRGFAVRQTAENLGLGVARFGDFGVVCGQVGDGAGWQIGRVERAAPAASRVENAA